MMSFNTPSRGPSERRSTPVCGDEAMSVSKIRRRYHYAGSRLSGQPRTRMAILRGARTITLKMADNTSAPTKAIKDK